MKTSLTPSPRPESGRAYWRSLDQLADTAEFRQWVEREFPEGASEWDDPVSRRHFVKIMSASFLLAGAGFAGSGCRRPVQKIEPFSRMPEDYVHGVAQYYATAMPSPGGAIPLVVKSHDGRPTKIEGNRQHPESNGGTDRFAQASILNLYDPDRATRFVCKGKTSSPEAAIDFLAGLSKEVLAGGGQGLAFLAEPDSSPSRRRLHQLIAEKLPKARWHVHDPIGLNVHRRAASLAFGKPVQPRYHLEKADVILSLDCDFLGSEEEVHNHVRRFTQRRRMEEQGEAPGRLYSVESLMTLTGINADHRLRLPASLVARAAARLAAEVPNAGTGLPGIESTGTLEGEALKWIVECAKDLAGHQGRSLVMAGHRQPLAVHLLALALNEALGNIGQTLVLNELPEEQQGNLEDLALALKAGEVKTLVILGANPVHSAPADLEWAAAQRKAQTVLRLGYYEDETFEHCDWHLPACHYLESWGDARTPGGTLVPIQPLIAPLFGGMTELELLARILGAAVTDPYSIVRETFAAVKGGGDIEAAWREYLHDGFLSNSAAKPVEARLDRDVLKRETAGLKATAPDKDNLEVVFHRDYKLDDGRYANNGWLQELPDPVTKITWDNVVLVSRKTAQELGVKNHDVIEIQLGGRKAEGPIWVQPGMADHTLGLALGYGRARAGRVGKGCGFDAYRLRTSASPGFAVGARVRSLGRTYPISCTQSHWSLEGRAIIREANFEQYRTRPDFAKRMAQEEPKGAGSLYPNPLDEEKKKGLHQWGMSIDLNMCVGCSACVLACQSENNVPIVGKEQVQRGREMHWLRIDRYYAGPSAQRKPLAIHHSDSQQQYEEWIDNPQAVTQPMLCQHCEAAPCENVCPVNATSHDQEGLNVMTYNRCVGTRYCSNNCPYKVRRFNFFDYNKRPLDKLYYGPLAKRPEDELQLAALVKNPDVTVRMRGVMEKCTFCIQRIEQAKIAQKVKAGASDDVVVPEGTFTTACAQACPAGAIVFGNLNDPSSRVSKLKALDRDYTVLEFLFTRPRTSYLARVRNPNPRMPDYHEVPLTFENYEHQAGHPVEEKPVEGVGQPETKGAH